MVCAYLSSTATVDRSASPLIQYQLDLLEPGETRSLLTISGLNHLRFAQVMKDGRMMPERSDWRISVHRGRELTAQDFPAEAIEGRLTDFIDGLLAVLYTQAMRAQLEEDRNKLRTAIHKQSYNGGTLSMGYICGCDAHA